MSQFSWPPNYLANLPSVYVALLAEFGGPGPLIGYTCFSAGRVGGIYQHPEFWPWLREMRAKMPAGAVRLPPKPNDPIGDDDDMTDEQIVAESALAKSAIDMGAVNYSQAAFFTAPALRSQAVAEGRPIKPDNSITETAKIVAQIQTGKTEEQIKSFLWGPKA